MIAYSKYSKPGFNDEESRISAFIHLFPNIDKLLLTWLKNNKYFTAPASTKYHGAYEGGLFDHSYIVARVLIDLTNDNKLIWYRPESPVIIGLFHDICKIDQYNYYALKDGASLCEFNTETLYKGHGDKSVIILSSHMQLTDEEAACIRYHMGAFTDKEEWPYYNRAIKIFPNVLWTHHADMIASQILEV